MVINKLDAAQRQLESAIFLYFYDQDPVSIHTLTAASYNILRDICKKLGLPPVLIKGLLLDYVREEKKKDFIHLLNEAENFFKHADQDHNGIIKFNPGQTELLLYDACSKYHEITHRIIPRLYLFQIWYMVNHVELFILPDEINTAIRTVKRTSVYGNRGEYYETLLPIIAVMVERGRLKYIRL